VGKVSEEKEVERREIEGKGEGEARLVLL